MAVRMLRAAAEAAGDRRRAGRGSRVAAPAAAPRRRALERRSPAEPRRRCARPSARSRRRPRRSRPTGAGRCAPSAVAGPAEPKAADPPLAAAARLRLRRPPRPRSAAARRHRAGVPRPGDLREGVVVLRLLISDTGHVDDVARRPRRAARRVRAGGARRLLEGALLARHGGAESPVKSQITVEVQFMPINRGARVSGRTY